MNPRPTNAVGGSCMGGIIGGIIGIVLGFAIAATKTEGYVSHTLLDLITVPTTVLVYFFAISGCGIVGAIGGAAIGAGVATIPRRNEAHKLAMPPDQATRSSPDSIEQDLKKLRQRIKELEKEQAENQE